MFRARCDFAVTIVEKKIYVAVGSQVCSTENQSLDDTEIFDTAPGACTQLPAMSQPGRLCSSVLSVEHM